MIAGNVSNKVLISVGIPVYNGSNYIRESIESVLNQTERNFELLIVDNCSTDQTLSIIREYGDPRIRVFVNEWNLGAFANFNRCIELAKGEFIVLLPHDDVLLPTALEIYSKGLAAEPQVGLAYSSYYVIDEKGKRSCLSMAYDENKVMSGNEAFTKLAKGCPIQCTMTRREIYSRLGSWDTNIIISDWDMWCRIALAGYKVAYFKDPQNCYRVHSKNGTKSYIEANKYHSGLFTGMEKIYDGILAQSDLQKLRPLSAQWIFESLTIHLIFSLIRGNWVKARQDMGLFAKIVGWAGVFRTLPVLLSMPWKMIRLIIKRLCGQNEDSIPIVKILR